MRAKEFITEAANILNVVAHDLKAVALFKSLLRIRGYNHYMRLVRKPHIENANVIQGENGWAYIADTGPRARVIISTDKVEIKSVKLSEIIQVLKDTIGTTTHYFNLIATPLSTADHFHTRKKHINQQIRTNDEKNYSLYIDPIFKKILITICNKILTHAGLIDDDSINVSKIETDLEYFDDYKYYEYHVKEMFEESGASLSDIIFEKLSEKYQSWDKPEIIEYGLLEIYLYRAKQENRQQFYSIVRTELLEFLLNRYMFD